MRGQPNTPSRDTVLFLRVLPKYTCSPHLSPTKYPLRAPTTTTTTKHTLSLTTLAHIHPHTHRANSFVLLFATLNTFPGDSAAGRRLRSSIIQMELKLFTAHSRFSPRSVVVLIVCAKLDYFYSKRSTLDFTSFLFSHQSPQHSGGLDWLYVCCPSVSDYPPTSSLHTHTHTHLQAKLQNNNPIDIPSDKSPTRRRHTLFVCSRCLLKHSDVNLTLLPFFALWKIKPQTPTMILKTYKMSTLCDYNFM